MSETETAATAGQRNGSLVVRSAEPADHEVAQPRRIPVARTVGTTIDVPAVRAEPRFAHVGDRVDAGRRVRAAVDVHHRFQRRHEVVVATSGDVA